MRVGVLVQAQEAPKSRAARALLRFHGALADLVVAISPMLERALRGARARVVLNYVGVPLPPKPEPRAERRGAAVRLLVIGTIDRHKRQDLAIAAVAELVSQGIDARLELVGLEADAPYAAELHAQVAAEDLGERVTFVGETSDVEPHLLAADALVLPSGEVTPLALMEAMARGTPVVAARVGSVPDVVGQDGVSGLLVPPSDPRALADAIRRLVETPGMAADLARNARARAEELFDERKSHERIERLLAGLLSESAAQKWGPPDAVVGS
jgi:glycosyltransferase involved in cell wall biosynthesis